MRGEADSDDGLFSETRSALSKYWSALGGWTAILRTIYPYVAVLLTVVAGRLWWREPNWVTEALALLPALLGFALAGYAMLAAFGDPQTRRVLVLGERDYLTTSSVAFVHFVLVQVACIVLALLSKHGWIVADTGSNQVDSVFAFLRVGQRLLGTWLLLYGVVLVVPTVLNVFRLIGVFAIAADAKDRAYAAEMAKLQGNAESGRVARVAGTPGPSGPPATGGPGEQEAEAEVQSVEEAAVAERAIKKDRY